MPSPDDRSSIKGKICITAVILLAAFLFQNLVFRERGETAPTVHDNDVHLLYEKEDTFAPPESQPKAIRYVVEGVVPQGATATSLLREYLEPVDVLNLSRCCVGAFPLDSIRIGRPYRVILSDGQLERFVYEIDRDKQLVAVRAGDDFAVDVEPIHYDIRLVEVEGVITSNLYQAVDSLGEEPALAGMIADVYQFTIDFMKDVREGDGFTLLVEKRYRDNAFAGYGRILACEFVNQEQHYEAYLFQGPNDRWDYYNEHGRSLRKAFLRAPLDYKRISSDFSRSRLHPILHVRRPHLGIDYAAPPGTPVWTVGDGVVTHVGRGHDAGNYVTIHHKNGFETSYMHLKGFARNIRRGVQVRQGQTIGYVGQTGLATGPHLDFRMSKNGQFINPRLLDLPSAGTLPYEMHPDFDNLMATYRARMGRTQFANAVREVDEP